MKNIFPIFITSIFAIGMIASCVDNSKANSKNNDPFAGNQTGCYAFTSGKDSVFMEIDIKDDSVTGNLTYKLFQKDQNKGTLEGKVKGDTLIADYTFMSEGTASVREVAFLKRGDELAEGYGDVVEKNGRMIFENRAALNFINTTTLKHIACTK